MRIAIAAAAVLVFASAPAAFASTASEREYQRGYNDCLEGRYDQDQHGESYQKGCGAAEDHQRPGTDGMTGRARTAPSLGTAPASDAKVKGTPYHATGQVSCSMGDAPRGSADCDFGVIRGALGNAELHLRPPGGLERVLTFIGDTVTSDAESKVEATKGDDMWSVDVNDYEHYQIPEGVIVGG